MGGGELNDRLPGRVLTGALALCLALQVWFAFVLEINWDEFFYLSHIYAFQSGEMAKVLQSFHVHLLDWVTAIPGDEIAQVEAGRLFMLACFTGTCALIYLLSRRFVSHIAALVAVLVFASAGYSVIHGASFRADPLAAFLTMASLVVLARGRVGWPSAVAAGLLAAVAGMITVKIILYAPAFLGIAAWRLLTSDHRRQVALRLGGSVVAAIAGFAILYLIQLGLVPKASNAASSAGLRNAAETQVGAGLLPRTAEILRFVFLSPLQAILLLTGLGVAVALLRDHRKRAEAVAVLGCGATLLCLLLYRNAFPYFFPFILAPAAVLAALAVDHLPILKKYMVLVAVGLVAPAAAVAAKWSTHRQTAQDQVVAAVHRIFPTPVAYIDRNSMIASFPKKGFFMSTWGLQNYRRAGAPVIADVLTNDVVPLVVANGPALENAFGALPGLPAEISLLDADKVILHDNFIPHWGPIYVAGKSLRPTSQGTAFTIRIPGDYTIEGSGAAIDGKAYRAGTLVPLRRGEHVVQSGTEASVTLRWGKQLPRQVQPFVGPVYRGF